MRRKTVFRLAACQLFFVLACLFFKIAHAGLDAPHTDSNGLGCLTCHNMTSTYPKLLTPLDHTPLNIDETPANLVCEGCHLFNPDIPVAYTHSSLTTSTRYGTWAVECWVCHNQHLQEQNRYNASTYGKYIRRSIKLDNIKGGDGNPLPGKSGIKSVIFKGQTDTNSFADGDTTYNGICEVCHTRTTHFRNDGSGSDQNHGNRQGTNCIECHNHANGFVHGGGGGGTNCGSCHHTSTEAANNNCTLTCHKAVDHSGTVAGDAVCIECHTATAGQVTGVPVSLTDPEVHNGCRTCHTFDADKRGILIDFTNQKGVLGTGPLPDGGTIGGQDGGGTCTACHTQTPAEAFHHTSPKTAIGQCEACHIDPRPGWGPNVPGDNGTAAGLTKARPTQMACLKCHVQWSGGNMLVSKFERAFYSSYSTPWGKTTVHTIPMTQTRINNLGICLSCHYVGSSKEGATPVTLWHAHPSKNASWRFFGKDETNTGRTHLRGSGSASVGGDRAHYVPGRSPELFSSTAPRSGISGFNIFQLDYKGHSEPTPYRSLDVDNVAYLAKAWDTPAFSRIAIPTNPKIGMPASATLNDATRAVPVFASLAPLTVASSAPDDIKVLYAIYAGSTLAVKASTSGACANLRVTYGTSTESMSGTTPNCTATITNPSYPASGTTVNVTTTNPLGLNIIGFPISEPNPGQLSFSAPTYSVNEDETTAAITVTRTGGLTGAVGVTWKTLSTGTATDIEDYLSESSTLTWTDGDTTDKTFTVTISDDPSAEADETVDLALSSPTGGAELGRPETAVLTIVDDTSPAGTIAFSAANYTVAENGDSVTITVTRSGGATGEVSVTYATNPYLSTAKAGSDYQEVRDTLTWTDGDSSDKTFTISTVNHNEIRGEKKINLYLFAPSDGATLGTPSSANVTIISPAVEVLDPWPTTPQLTGTTGNLSGTFEIGLAGNRLLVVAVSCSDTSASGQTFSATYGGKTLTQAFLENSNRRQTWIGYLKETDIVARNNDDTITVTVNGAHTDVAAFVASYRNVNQIRPIAGAGGSYASYTPTSPSTTVVSAFNLNQAYVARGGYVLYNWAGDPSYERLADYEEYVEHADRDQGDMRIGIASKPYYTEEYATANVSWTTPAVTRYVSASLVSLNSYAGPPALTFTASARIFPSIKVDESASTATISVSRLGSASGAVSVNYATTTGGTAVEGVDYYAASGTLTWADGDMADKTFTVNIINNSIVNTLTRNINLALNDPTNGAILGPNSNAILTISDDDSTLKFSAATFTVAETGTYATINVTRTGSIGAVGVSYATAGGGSASAGSDYEAVAGSLSWGNGESGNKSFTIPITNDADSEGDETINLSLSSPAGGASLVYPSTAVLTIQDDEASLAFNSATYSVAEGGGSATITVSRLGNKSLALNVDFRAIAGTASEGSDYSVTSGTLSFPANWTSKTFTVPILEDANDEDAETVNLELSNVTGGGTLGAQNTAVLTIQDNDRIGTVAFSAPTYSVDEDTGLGKVTITATRTNGAGKAGSVNYTYANVTATYGNASAGDYYFFPATGTLSWADGDPADKSFDVSIYPDSTWEGNHTADLILSNPTGGVTLGAPTTTTLTIVDDNDFPGTLTLSSPIYTVNEDGGTATITVRRTGGFNSYVSVRCGTTTGGTATAWVDYTPTSPTLSWVSGDTSDKTVTISILNNSINAPDKTVNLALSNPVGVVLGPPSTAVLTIVEDEAKAGTISFAAPKYSVAEDVGTATISATRSGGSSGAVTVDYRTVPTGSTATADWDYTATAGTLSWAAGETGSKTLSLAIVADTAVEGNETVQLNLENVIGGATLASPDKTWVTIEGPAVAPLDFWTANPLFSRYSTDTNLTHNSTFSIGDGPNRLLLVAVSTRIFAGTTGHTYSATYGGKPLTQATIQNTHEMQTWIGYLQEADIASRNGNVVTLTVNGTTDALGAYVASYMNVDQANPLKDSGGYYGTANVVSVNPVPLQAGAGGYALYNWAAMNTFRTDDTENYTEDTDKHLTAIYVGIASKPFPTATTSRPRVNWDGTVGNPAALSIITLNKFGDSLDSDLDTIGDDGDGTGIPGDHPCTGGQTANCDDNCLSVANGDQADGDGDGIGDGCDNCPADPNTGQVDSDCDGLGDACSTPVYSPPAGLTFTPGQLVDLGTVSWNDSFAGEAGYRIERKAEACSADTLPFEPVATVYHLDEFTHGIDETAWSPGARIQSATATSAPYAVADANGSAEVRWDDGAVQLRTMTSYHLDGDIGYNQSYLVPRNFTGIFGETDFDIQYDFSYSLANPYHLQYNKYASLDAYFPATAGGNAMHVSRQQGGYYTGIQINGEPWESGEFSTNASSGKLRLIRKDRRLAGYAWDGSGWKLLHEHSKQLDQEVAPTWIGAIQIARRNEISDQEITTRIDNFRLNTVAGQPVAKLSMDFNENQWLGNSGEVIDSAVDGNHGTAHGGATTILDGDRGMVGSFDWSDGVDDYVSIPGSGTLQGLTSTSFTFAAWAKPADVPPQSPVPPALNHNDWVYAIVTRSYPPDSLTYGGNKLFSFYVFDTSWAQIKAIDPTVYEPGTWHQLVGVADDASKTIALYVDGQLKATTSYAGKTLFNSYGTSPYLVGISNPGQTEWVFPFKGKIDDVRIYDHALTSTEIQALYNNSMQVGDSGLASGTEYCYRVYPFKNDTCPNWSNHAAEMSISTANNTVPHQPVNEVPGSGATDVYELHPALAASPFADDDAGDTHLASQWLVSTQPGVDFDDHIIYNSGTTAAVTNHTVATSLATNTIHYWRVRYQDSKGGWSLYSDATSFLISNAAPDQPVNGSPAAGATVAAITPDLGASLFTDSDSGDTHQASQWLISTGSGAAFDPNMVYDSGAVAGAETHTVAAGLSFGTTYFWKVRYQDNRGTWSAYSGETDFSTFANVAPDQPTAGTPANGAVNVSITATLTASSFHDGDVGDSHQASQWLVSTGSNAAFNANIFYDNGVLAASTTLSLPSQLQDNTSYYWKVRYQDSKGVWSVYSGEAGFTTAINVPPDQPVNIAPTNGAVDEVRKPTLTASAFADGNLPDDLHQAGQWQVSTDSGDPFAANILYDSGAVAVTTEHTVTTALPPATTFFWRVRYQDRKGDWSPYSVETSFTTAALISLWHLDEGSGTTASDAFGDNNGTVRNGAVWAAAFAGNGLLFDGVDDDIVWNYVEGIPANNFTLEAMVRATTTHEIDTESTSGTTGTAGQRYLFGAAHCGTNGGAGVSVGTNGISVYEHGSGYMPPLAVYSGSLGTGWNHIVVTYTGKRPRIYLNGTLVRTGLTSTRTNVYAPLQLGGGPYGFFPGTIDEVAVYRKALSDAEVLQRCRDLGQCAP